MEFIVRARCDGRGGIKPFGTFTKHQAGAKVNIGGKNYKVTKDGRVNIPKKIMNKMGVTGKDGRKRISINFSTKPSTKTKEHWKHVAALISKPHKQSKDLNTNDTPKYDVSKIMGDLDFGNDLLPESDEDYIWS